MRVEGYPSVEDTLVELRSEIDGMANGEEEIEDAYRQVQYRALARQLAGAIAMVHVIDGNT